LTFTNVVRHEIKTHHENPIYKKPYGYTFLFEKEVESQIQDMLKPGITRLSQSPYYIPLWII